MKSSDDGIVKKVNNQSEPFVKGDAVQFGRQILSLDKAALTILNPFPILPKSRPD